MPDGLYKTFSKPQEWRRLLRHCEREADRGTRTRADAENATRVEANKELSRSFINGLLRIAADAANMLPGLDPFSEVRNGRDLGGQGADLENDIVRRLSRLHRQGLRGEALASQAVQESLDRRISQRILQIEQHCLVNRGERARPIIDAARDAGASVDTSALATTIVRGEKPDRSTARASLELNENLLGASR